jgi:hypothetical protein
MGKSAQYRHRGGGTTNPPLPAPVITGGSFSIGTTDPGFADVQIDWTFDPAPYGDADIEIWWFSGYVPAPWNLIASVPSTDTSYVQLAVTDVDDRETYKIRYVNGPLQGPFSNEFPVEVVF